MKRFSKEAQILNDVVAFSTKGFKVIVIEATQIAIDLGNHRAANVVLLGALAELLEIPDEVWNETLTKRIPEKFRDLNREAFSTGREFATPAS